MRRVFKVLRSADIKVLIKNVISFNMNFLILSNQFCCFFASKRSAGEFLLLCPFIRSHQLEIKFSYGDCGGFRGAFIRMPLRFPCGLLCSSRDDGFTCLNMSI
ncbi:hypothetical protein NPIL_103511 [Nephila pilipes]|uniref:Uncharacterized protein n=1 Tax=Nephila pilipes TaxID=299642 RepID=A0A8X6U5W0_NEPPI|nr:hypothetical protein NPIL_103511 [Nephila pilipes]